jgi:hypothetical protein
MPNMDASSSAADGSGPLRLPRLFVWARRPRVLCAFGALALASGAAMLPAMATMSHHGASLLSFEYAGSVARSSQIVTGWGHAGRAAAWWQLALDEPFLIGYGLFLAGACAAVAKRARATGHARLARAGIAFAWCGPLAAGSDLIQNIALALVLTGHHTQPWPRISAVCGAITLSLATIAALFSAIGLFATRQHARAPRPARQSR